MAKTIKCPNCGSESIIVNGVRQRKKGLLYHLSGQAAYDAGVRAGFKTANKLAHGTTNAECIDCGHKWMHK